MNEQLRKFRSVTSEQKEMYDSKMEYMGLVGQLKAELEVVFEEFIVNPNSIGFDLLETKMMQYQNIRCNCDYEDYKEE
jgi:hypothetical protein